MEAKIARSSCLSRNSKVLLLHVIRKVNAVDVKNVSLRYRVVKETMKVLESRTKQLFEMYKASVTKSAHLHYIAFRKYSQDVYIYLTHGECTCHMSRKPKTQSQQKDNEVKRIFLTIRKMAIQTMKHTHFQNVSLDTARAELYMIKSYINRKKCNVIISSIMKKMNLLTLDENVEEYISLIKAELLSFVQYATNEKI